jgi:hypothetical protein
MQGWCVVARRAPRRTGPGIGSCAVLERTKRLPHRRLVRTLRGRAATRQRGPTVPWGPPAGRAARPLAPSHVEGIRTEEPADGEHRLRAMPRAMLALLPARRPTMTTCCVCEPAGAPSLVARETKPDLTPVCASSSEASTRPALVGIMCEDRAHCLTPTANDLIFGARRKSLPRLDDGEDSAGRERDVEADQRDCLVHSCGEVSPPKSDHPAKHTRYKLRQSERK